MTIIIDIIEIYYDNVRLNTTGHDFDFMEENGYLNH